MDSATAAAVFKGKTQSAAVSALMGETVRTRHGRDSPWTTMYNRHNKTSKTNYSYNYKSSTEDVRGVSHHAGPPNTARPHTPRVQLRGACLKMNWRDAVNEYCTNSTLHGLRYAGDSKLSHVERTFWFVAFALAVLAAGYYINMLYDKWVNNPVIVSVGAKRTSLVSFPFPALTVCNMNRAKLSVAKGILSMPFNSVDRLLLNDLCDMDNTTTSSNDDFFNQTSDWEVVKQFMVKVSQSCSEMIRTCKFAGKLRNCDELFNTALTDEGLCCTFNQVNRSHLYRNPLDLSDLNVTAMKYTVKWTPDDGYPPGTPVGYVPYRPRGAGVNLGLSLTLDAQLDEYFCSSTQSKGFKMILHNPVETPKVKMFAFLVEPGRESRIVIRPSISGSTKALRAILKEKRLCAFSDEQYLKYYKTYTQKNCALECEANFTLEQCGCVSYYMPKNARTRICGKEHEACAEDARRTMEIRLEDKDANVSDIILKASTRPSCNCMPGCNELGYTSYLTSAKLQKINGSRMFGYDQKSMAEVHFFFTESQFLNFEKGELFGFIEFLSSTGGLLGLFMGFSFLSVVEALYFVSLRLWCTLVRGKRVANNQPLLLSDSNKARPFNHYPYRH